MAIDVALWLRGLGLEQYAPGFADNDVDAAVLPELTAEDLIALGVSSIGHRQRLLSAIATLRGQPPEVVTPAPAAVVATEAERRQLTVVFCDLVGSTALSVRFDPEDLREVIAAYHGAVADVVRSFDGFVAKYMGDGVLIYFGYPRAHEDDAERAVRAGLGLVEAVSRLGVKSVTLGARVGIATGLVVVGDLIGEGSAREQSVVGETPNLAARLQVLAEPGAVVIAADTHRLLSDLFEYCDLGTAEVKGLESRVPVWQVLRPSIVESRFDALRTAGLTPLVGREEETELLSRRWESAKRGEGQVVLISGEPGIGKSRIAAALRDRIEGSGIPACAISARLTIRTARYIRSSPNWSVLPDLRMTIRLKRNWTSLKHCWRNRARAQWKPRGVTGWLAASTPAPSAPASDRGALFGGDGSRPPPRFSDRKIAAQLFRRCPRPVGARIMPDSFVSSIAAPETDLLGYP